MKLNRYVLNIKFLWQFIYMYTAMNHSYWKLNSMIILANQMTLFSIASKTELISFKIKTLSLKPWHTLYVRFLSEINMTDFIHSLACTPSLGEDFANLHSLW